MAFISVKAYAKADLLARLLQQRHVPAELCSYPLTPMQMLGQSHCSIPSPEPMSLQPFASTENNNPQTEILREITFQMKFVGFIMEEHLHACAPFGKGRKVQNNNCMSCWSIISGMLVQKDELSAFPQAIYHTVPQLMSKSKKYICKISHDSSKA